MSGANFVSWAEAGSRVVHALAGSMRVCSLWGLCSLCALLAVRYLENSGPGGRLVKISDGAACLLGQCPPTLTGHWVLGFLGRMWFLTLVPGTREGSCHPLVNLINDPGSLEGLWPG